jgi:hypothetical protein
MTRALLLIALSVAQPASASCFLGVPFLCSHAHHHRHHSHHKLHIRHIVVVRHIIGTRGGPRRQAIDPTPISPIK